MSVPVLSTTHLSKNTVNRCESGDCCALCAPYDEGFFIYIDAEQYWDRLPEDVVDCFRWAKARGFEWCRFDAGGDIVDDLKTFDR